jgi:hypothetical protein
MAILKYKLPPIKGLAPKLNYQYRPEYIEDCENILISDDGVCRQINGVPRTFSTLDETAQIFNTKSETLVCIDDTIYSYDGSTLTQELTSIATGERWSCADFGFFVVLTNGTVNVVRNINTDAYAVDTTPIMPVCMAICAHRGRLIGVGSINYSSSDWLDISAATYPMPGDAVDYIYNNFVIWSKINDLTFQKNGTPDRTNLSGYMPVEFSGRLLRVEPLKDKIIVYGENGIAALQLAGTGYGQTTIHTTGIKGLYSVCVNGVADGITEHYFVDKNGNFCRINSNASVDILGYKNLFGSATEPKFE